jgi:hypothetical protein
MLRTTRSRAILQVLSTGYSFMQRALLLAALLFVKTGLAAPPPAPDRQPNSGSASASVPPLQIEARVPFAPTLFPSMGYTYLAYELYLTNFSPDPIEVRRLDVLDAEASSQPVTSFEEEQLDAILKDIGAGPPAGDSRIRQLGPGRTVVAFMWIPFDDNARVPQKLLHRLVTADSSIEGASVSTHHTQLSVLAPPLRGVGWRASDGPSNAPSNHHRRGILLLDGQAAISGRYAFDWMLSKNDHIHSGNPRDNRSYYSYGQPVFAVADAIVVQAKNEIPDNVPGPLATFHPAVPITMETIGGNNITLDLGGGQYAWYFHLQPGSVRVRTGDHVRRGELLARVGCSGDPPIPHLHFELTTSSRKLAGEGIPYLLDHYRVWTNGKVWETRAQELPLDTALIDFGQDDKETGMRSKGISPAATARASHRP